MSKLKSFITAIPALCDCKLSNAIGLRNQITFEYEVNNPDCAFARRYFDSDEERISGFFDFEGYEDKKEYCKALLLLRVNAYYKVKEETEDYDDTIAELVSFIESKKEGYSEITSTFSLSNALENEDAEPRWD